MRNIHRAAFIASLVIIAGQTGLAQSTDSEQSGRIVGVYALTEVNGHNIPAPAWHRASADSTCVTVLNTGSLMLDSHGRWAAFMTERDRCNMSLGRNLVKPDVATMFAGRFTVNGNTIELQDDSPGGGRHVGTIAGDTIILTAPGVGELVGQQTTYTLKRVRDAR